MSRLLALALASAACSPEPRTRAEPEPTCGVEAEAVQIDAFCVRYYAARCAAEARCKRLGDRPTPWDDCNAWAEAHAPACEATWVALAAAGATGYDAAEAGRCVACTRVLACTDLDEIEDAHPLCVRSTFAGKGLLGDACHDDVGCIRRLACDLSEGCPGRCGDVARVPRGKTVGEPCGPDAGTCGLGLHCAGTGRCAAYELEGRACGEESGTCNPTIHWCAPQEGGGATCAPLPGPGGACGALGGTSAPSCTGSVCDPDVEACVLVREQGERCTVDEQCHTWSCGQTRTCGPIRTPEPDCAP